MHEGRRPAAIMARCAAMCLAAFAAWSCATLDPRSLLPEPGWYYGVGTGASAAEAAGAARVDLISRGLTGSRDRTGVHGAPVVISAEAAKGFALPKLRPYAQKKDADSVSMAYRLKVADWDMLEEKRQAAARAEIVPKAAALRTDTARPFADRMRLAGRLLTQLDQQGLTQLLTESGTGSPLVSQVIWSTCRDEAEGLAFTIDPAGGFIETGATLRLHVADREGATPGELAIRVQWSATGAEPWTVTLATDAQGNARLGLPTAGDMQNRTLHLAVSTNLAAASPAAVFADIDSRSVATFRYQHFDDIAAAFSTVVRVPAGPFTAGAPARDRRATRREAARPAATGAYLVDRYPVTNALYGMYLDDAGGEPLPEYWDNPAYNQADQPVIGVSWEDANRFAAWLSDRLGVRKRLPTEDEWEKAARAGQDVLYPWGDQGPAEGPRANFSGNGRFQAPSPVGSFPTGANAWGLLDMAGNVWQWTVTRGEQAAGGMQAIVVKGGSWMDGPADLRISNRRELDPDRGYADVGLRLVTEVSDE